MNHSRIIFKSFNGCSIQNFGNDWIRTAYLWYRKLRLCQLSHNHIPKFSSKLSKNVAHNVTERERGNEGEKVRLEERKYEGVICIRHSRL